MAFIEVPAGTNPKFTITIKDESGAVVDPTSLVGYGFVVYKKPAKVLARFSKNVKSGWLSLENETTTNFDVIIPLSGTAQADENSKYYCEILIETTDGSNNFISKNPGGSEFIEVTESPTADITSLA